jgi:hypothetical protein
VSHSHVDLTERVAVLRSWAEARIAECREVETNTFARSGVSHWEAVAKRETLTEVLDRLGYPVSPKDLR